MTSDGQSIEKSTILANEKHIIYFVKEFFNRVDIGSGSDLLPGGTNRSPEPTLAPMIFEYIWLDYVDYSYNVV